MTKTKLAQLLLLFLPSISFGVEFLCWQGIDIPSMAYETSSTSCGPEKKLRGTISQKADQDKKINCTAAALCLAVPDDVLAKLKNVTRKNSLKEIESLGGDAIDAALAGTGYIGRASQVLCEGKGSMGSDGRGGYVLVKAECPDVTTCMQSEEVIYGLGLIEKVKKIVPCKKPEVNRPSRLMPNETGQQ